MNIVVFGANGRVGSLVVARLLAEGHTVRAFIHSSSQLASHPRLKLIKGDVHRPADVWRAVKGSEAVVCALGSWGTKSKDILTAGMEALIPAMNEAGVRRIVSLTGAGARDSVDWPVLLERLSRPLLLLAAPRILRDGERHLSLLRASRLDWTVLRSPVMRSSGPRGYRLSPTAPPPWATIARTDVVDALVRLVTDTEQRRAAPFITRSTGTQS